MQTVPYVNMARESDMDEVILLFEQPKTYIRRWNRCMWILIICLVFTLLMIGTLIPGAVGLAQGDRSDDTLVYLSLIAFIFAGLFFMFWYSCQIETTDVHYYEREDTHKSIKRKDDGPRHMRPKSLRAPLASVTSIKKGGELHERTSLVENEVTVKAEI
ncbi:uncharacterized protein LOC120345835 isoform X2 [Styela clava]